MFLNFLNFFAFFFGILLSGSSRNEFGTKFFSLSFSSLSHPDLNRNNVGMIFFNYFDFFCNFFFGVFMHGSGRNGIWV